MNNRLILTKAVGLAGIAVALVTFSEPLTGQEQATLAEGARVYGNTCGTCHNARSPLERTDRAWVTIANHMRVRGNLTGRQVRAVLAFLQGTNTDPRERIRLGEVEDTAEPSGPGPLEGTFSDDISTDAETIARGEALITQKACIGCHVVGGVGGNVGPRLDDAVERRGARYLRQKLQDPTFDDATSMMPNLGLTDEEIDALIAYLATFNNGSSVSQ